MILPLRIYYEDTDFSGFVYHARYLHFFERGRTEFLRALGIHHRALHEAEGGPFGFVVHQMNVEYHAPARMDDEVMVHTRLVAISGARLTMHQKIMRGADCLTEAQVVIAFLAKGRASRLSPDLRTKLDVYQA
jgi:acyl-CoA thioester hydrolase